MSIEMTEFAKRQYADDYAGPVMTPKIVDEIIDLVESEGIDYPGYADFNKVVAVKNKQDDGSYRYSAFKSLTVNREWAIANGGIIKTAYEARRPEELPVLVEWVEGLETPTADWMHVILYNKEQLIKEGDDITADWGLVAVATGNEPEIEPMRPATITRNALGVEEGGSGVPIDHDFYRKSAKFWSENIAIREC